MEKARRIFALAGVILILALYALTLIFALQKNPAFKSLFLGALFCSVAVPVILYVLGLLIKNAKKGNDDPPENKKP